MSERQAAQAAASVPHARSGVQIEEVRDPVNAMSTIADSLPSAASADGSTELLSRCLRAMDLIDAACRQRDGLEEDLRALGQKITEMTIKLAAATADVSRARYQSFHDGLTLLPNRQLFLSTLVSMLADTRRKSAPLAVLCLDLDGFKAVNDVHGHQLGDELLRIVGARLLHGLRAQDMVCRMGGDEFACLLIGVANTKQLRAVASKIHTRISAAAIIGEIEINIRPSIGIAVYPQDGITALELLNSADLAMYAAKQRRSSYALSGDPGLSHCGEQHQSSQTPNNRKHVP